MQVDILEPTIITMKGDINDEDLKHDPYHHQHQQQLQQQQINDQDHYNDSNTGSSASTTVSFINRYELIKEIGKGSFSKVFLCQERNTHQKYAVKVCMYAYMYVSISMCIASSASSIITTSLYNYPSSIYYYFNRSLISVH